MTNDDADRLLVEMFGVSRETLERISAFEALLRAENERQNLVSRATMDNIRVRHTLDSVQLIRHAPREADTWLDLGSGAGFPGLIIASVYKAAVTMVESRRLRVDFLHRAADVLQLPTSTRIVHSRVESLESDTYDVISARAFAPLGRLFDIAHRFAAPQTRWVLPKGRSAQSELDAVGDTWQGMFHVEPSLTDPEAGIIVAEQVMRRGRGS